MSKKEKGQPLRKAKPAPTVSPKVDRTEKSKTKVPTIQESIREFSKRTRKIEKLMGTQALLTRFILYLDKKGFVIVHRNDVAHVAVRYLAFESKLK